MNFLKHVMQQLDDHSLGLLGAVLGENESKVRDGVNSAVPKILGAMVSVAKVEQGRDMLWRELRDTDTTVASSFSKQLYYKDSQALVANGHDQLDSLIGAETNRLFQSVSRESDIGSTSAKRLVGAVTPLVFAAVANHQQSKQLNQSELGAVIAQQKSHLSDWERQSGHSFPGGSKNEDENEPLFSSLPKAGGAAVVATAVGSASLGMHHLRNRDEDQQSDASKKGSDPTAGNTTGGETADLKDRGRATAYGGQTQSKREKANEKNLTDSPSGIQRSEADKGSDQRSQDRRDRKPIAANPADSGFGANTSKDNQPSKSTAAGAIAAAGAAAGVGAAGVAAAALTPSAKTTTEDSSASLNRDKSTATNTYDSENAVSGFAAAKPSDLGTSATAGQAETYDGNAKSEGNSKLWTPDSAQQNRDADGTLRYSDSDGVASASTSGNTHAAGKKSGGWFHWLWWPVLIFGSLLALAVMPFNFGGGSSQPTDQEAKPAVATTSVDESNSSDGADPTALIAGDENSNEAADATALTAGDEDSSDTIALAAGEPSSSDAEDGTTLTADDESPKDSESESEESKSSILSSSIQITPSESGAKANDPSKELSPGLATADPSNEGDGDSASQTQDSGSPVPNATGKTTAGSTTSNQDDMPSLEGSFDTDEAGDAKNETDSAGDNVNSGMDGTNVPQLNTTDLELDADEQVEELLSAIETELGEVSDKAQAKVAKKSLSQHISGLEKVLAGRAQWKDEIEILVDFQLEEGKKMLALAEKKAFQSEAVKKALNGTFKELNTLMKTTDE